MYDNLKANLASTVQIQYVRVNLIIHNYTLQPHLFLTLHNWISSIIGNVFVKASYYINEVGYSLSIFNKKFICEITHQMKGLFNLYFSLYS